MNSRLTCRMVDAKAAHRAWSRRRMLAGILAVAISAGLATPILAYADDLDSQVESASEAEAGAEGGTTDTGAGAAGDANAGAGTVTADTGTGGDLTPADADSTATSASPAGDDGTAGTGGSGSGDTNPAGGSSDQDATASADSLGTSIQFDYDGDGSTTQSDWQQFLDDLLSYTYTPSASQDRTQGRGSNLQEVVVGQIADSDGLDLGVDVENVTQYYLNNIGQATSVKRQSPWGTCWSFSAISALESSILKARAGQAGQLIDESLHTTPKLTGLADQGVDLSELYFAWLAYSLNSQGSQAGEGLENIAPESVRDEWEAHLGGGFASYADTLFGAWRGIAEEADYPYFSEELKEYVRGVFSYYVKTYGNNWYYYFTQTGGNPLTTGAYETWTGEPDTTAEVSQIAHVNGVYYLPGPNITQEVDGKVTWQGHDDNADKLIKQALVKYGAVAVTLMAPYYETSDTGASLETYFNQANAALYNDTATPSYNHVVTIVGWNDSYPASNFQTTRNDTSNLPNGAWLVKNSWGSADTSEDLFGVSNYGNWDSILDEDGLPTGYFWLSYYDHTILSPMFFSVDDGSDGFDYDNNYSYDTAAGRWMTPLALRTADAGTLVANVFTAEDDEILKAVSVRTNQSNSHATIWVYLVDDDDLDDQDPTNDGEAVIRMEYDAVLAGLHTVELTSPVSLKKGQRFAIVENVTSTLADAATQDAASQGSVSWLNLETDLSQHVYDENPQADGYYRHVLVANDGETYARVLTDDGYAWLTPAQLAQAILGGDVVEFGSAMVKAFTVNVNRPAAARDGGTASQDAVIAVVTQDASGARHVRLGSATGAGAQSRHQARHMAALPATGDSSRTPLAGGLAALGAGLLGLGSRLHRRRMARA